MGAAVVSKSNHRLSDGRMFRGLPGLHTQPEVLQLHRWSDPHVEGIMRVRDFDAVAASDGAWGAIKNDTGRDDCIFFRTRQFGFYRMGFDKDHNLAIGKKILWIESEVSREPLKLFFKGDNFVFAGEEFPDAPIEQLARLTRKDPAELTKPRRVLVAVLDLAEIADEKVLLHDGKEVKLQDAPGMGVILSSKLDLNIVEATDDLIIYGVSPSSDFDPTKDLAVKNVLRPTGLSTSIDEDGFALIGGRILDKGGCCTLDGSSAMTFRVRNFNEFEINLPPAVEATLRKTRLLELPRGWHGSVGCNYRPFSWGEPEVIARSKWSFGSGVALVDQSVTAPLEAEA